MENRIKEAQGDLFADRTSAATMRANQLRLWFASMAYVLLCALRRIGLAHTQFAAATCGTIRLKLLKIGALVKISARRVKIAFASCRGAARTCSWLPSLTRQAATRLSCGIPKGPLETEKPQLIAEDERAGPAPPTRASRVNITDKSAR